jgi:hypothetical protein
MSEEFGLDRWLPHLLNILHQRNIEIPCQLLEAEKRIKSAPQLDEEAGCVAHAIRHVLRWERGLITELENLIHEWAEDLEVVGTDFHPAFRELLALDSYKWEEEDVPPPTPDTGTPVRYFSTRPVYFFGMKGGMSSKGGFGTKGRMSATAGFGMRGGLSATGGFGMRGGLSATGGSCKVICTKSYPESCFFPLIGIIFPLLSSGHTTTEPSGYL